MMVEYLTILDRIHKHGTLKEPTRVEGGTLEGTIGLPNQYFSYNMTNGFPLLTTRPIAWKPLVGELRSFLVGESNQNAFEKNGCNFWKPWAKEDGDLGPIYGVQWNRHGQLQHVLDCLKKRQTDRRMVVSAWRPDEHEKMALRPCHVMWIVTVYDGKLNLAWFQRSCDFPIGVPFNIGSYGLLLSLLAKWGNLKVGNLTAMFCDAHIYNNQLQGVSTWLYRIPQQLPQIRIESSDTDFNDWEVSLRNYVPQPRIDLGEVQV